MVFTGANTGDLTVTPSGVIEVFVLKMEGQDFVWR